MKSYYDLFVKYSLQQCTQIDYRDKVKVKKHNVASKKILQLQSKIKNDKCVNVLEDLLYYDDERVKINAAFLCLQMNVFIKKATVILNIISKTSSDPTMRLNASMILHDFDKSKNR